MEVLFKDGLIAFKLILKEWIYVEEYCLFETSIKCSRIFQNSFARNQQIPHTFQTPSNVPVSSTLLSWFVRNDVKLSPSLLLRNQSIFDFQSCSHTITKGSINSIKCVETLNILPENNARLLELLCGLDLKYLFLNNSTNIDHQFLTKLVSQYSNLTELSITGSNSIQDESMAILFRNCTNLKSIQINDSELKEFPLIVTSYDYFASKLTEISTSLPCEQIMTLCFGYTQLLILRTTTPLSHFALQHIIGENCTNLTTLHCAFSDTVCDDTLSNLATLCTLLCDVSFTGCESSNLVGNDGMIKFVKKLPNLTSIKLSVFVTSTFSECILCILQTCRSLQELSLSALKLDFNAEIWNELINCVNLRKFHNVCTYFGDTEDNMLEIVSYFQMLLRHKTLIDICLRDEMCRHFIFAMTLTKILYGLHHIQKITFGNTNIMLEELQAMFDALNLSSLQELTINCVSIMKDSGNILAPLEFASNLRILRLLNCNFINDDHLIFIAKHCRKLEHLAIFGYSCFHIVDESLCFVVAHLKNLRSLVISYQFTSPELGIWFKKQCREIKVTNSDEQWE